MNMLDMLQEKYVCSAYDGDERYKPGATVRTMDDRRYRITRVVPHKSEAPVAWVYGVEIYEDDSVVDRGWLVLTLFVCAVALFFVAAHFGAAVAS